MSKSRIELSYRFTMAVEGTTGHEGVTRFYTIYVAPEDLQELHEDIKAIAVKNGAIKNGKKEEK